MRFRILLLTVVLCLVPLCACDDSTPTPESGGRECPSDCACTVYADGSYEIRCGDAM